MSDLSEFDLNKGFDDLNKGFDDLNKGFDDLNKGFDYLINKQEEKVFGSKGKETPPSTPPADPDSDPVKEPVADRYIGESKAYNGFDVEFDIYGNIKQKEKSSPSSSGGGIKKPERDKGPKSGGGGKDIMDIFWNEVIVPAYTGCLSKSVDLTLDFFDYVLFDAYIPQSAQKKEEEKEQKDIWSLCRKVYEKYDNTAKEGMDTLEHAHKELMENIELAKNGLGVRWKVWPNKKAPQFFDEFVEIAKKAEADPNSPEAETWKRINSVPEVMKGLFNKELILRKLSISMAGMEIALASENYTLPKDIVKKIKEMEKLSSIEDEDKYKKEIKTKISEFKELIKEDSSVNKELAKTLEEIEKDINDPKKNQKNRTESIGKKIEKMKDIKPFAQEAEIDEKSQKYYDEMSQNIEKIKELYPENAEKISETIQNYLESVNETTKKALVDVNKSLNANHLGQAMRAAGKKAKIAYKRFTNQNIPVEDTVIINEMRKKAQESFRASVSSISGFMAGGQQISSRPDPAQTPKSPFANKKGLFTLYKQKLGR